MKKYYKFGEIILALREEYKESKYLLDELNKCINIKSEYSNYYFTGLLSRDDQVKDLSDRKIRLYPQAGSPRGRSAVRGRDSKGQGTRRLRQGHSDGRRTESGLGRDIVCN